MRVYVMGPYTKGDVAVNVRHAIEVGNILMDFGYSPYVPHLSHFQHLLYPRPYGDWIENDLIWLPVCHAGVHLIGESASAANEHDFADKAGIPVFEWDEPNGANAIFELDDLRVRNGY